MRRSDTGTAVQTQPARNLLPYVALVATALFWGSHWVVARSATDDVPPAALAFGRWLVAFAALTPFALGHVRRDWPAVRAGWRPLAILGLLGVALWTLFAYWGLSRTTASNGAILNALIPIFILVAARIVLGERLSGRRIAGVALSLAGALAIVVRGDAGALARLELNVGDLLIMVGIGVWALYTVGLRWRPPGLHPLTFLWALIAVGLLVTGVVFAIERASGAAVRLSGASIAAIVYIGLVPALGAYVLWNYGVSRLGPATAGLSSYLIPVFGALLAAVFLGEALRPYHLAGAGLVFAGLYLCSKR